MQRSKQKAGERRRGSAAREHGETPLLLLLLAVFSVTLLGFATARVASASTLQEPPMELPSEAGISSVGSHSDARNWIVGGVPGKKTSGIASKAGATPINRRLGSYRVPRGKANRLADRLDRAGRLVYAEPDVKLTPADYPSDKLADQQWWLDRIVTPADVTPPSVSRQSPMIALIEESIDPNHPDLKKASLTRAKSLGSDADTHGTSIAGIIGSPGENLGIRGVWPGARMRLFASGLSCSTASKAVSKAVKKGAAVINMSYTFPADKCFTHFKATQFAVSKGVLPVAAAGNSGASDNSPARPAVDPHVLSVGAVDERNTIADFSTRNPQVDLVAPGVGILAPIVYDEGGQTIRSWGKVNGTSFATPMVSAAAAWLTQARPTLGNLQISRLLTRGATDLGDPGRDDLYGAGLLNIEQSLYAPDPPVDPYEPNDDVKWLNGKLLPSKAHFLWRAGVGKRRILNATLSVAKDPADVYRVMIPGRSRIVVNVNQLEGDVELSAYKPSLKSIKRPGRRLIVRSDRPYPKTEGIVVRNLKKRRQVVWLALTPSSGQIGDDSVYRIKVVRR